MQHFRRAVVRLIIHSLLALVLVALNGSFLFAQQNQQTAPPAPPLRSPSSSVTLTVTVRDRQKNYVKGLTQSSFAISDGKQEQQIRMFSAGDVPLSVGVLLDTSMSVGKSGLQPFRDALARFFQLSEKRNEYFLMSFSTQPKLLQDWTNDAESMLKHFTAIRADGATALYDASRLALEKVARGKNQRRVLLLISDGEDSISETSLAEVKRLLEESDVLLYSISNKNITSAGGAGMGGGGSNTLGELSGVTGGTSFFPDGGPQINAVFDLIAIELRNQYLIGFTPTATDGKRHSLTVKVFPPANAPREMQSLTVRSRKSFYAKLRQP